MQLKYYLLLGLTALLASCSAPKEVLYLQDITSLKEETIDKNYEVIICLLYTSDAADEL